MSNELAAFLRQYADLVFVQIESEDSGSNLDLQALLADTERLHHTPILRLALSDHHEWAHAHGIYGAPALIAYHRHQCLFCMVGRVTVDELRQRFNELDL